jgi:hypothetical protein
MVWANLAVDCPEPMSAVRLGLPFCLKTNRPVTKTLVTGLFWFTLNPNAIKT